VSEPATELERAARLVRGAGALLICAGAGMGVDSGLPDFRGPEGFWRAYPPYRRLGLGFTDLADPVHFIDDPQLAWGFYSHRLALYRCVTPHVGFAVLRRWAERWPTRIFTSNVDGQFQRAGFPEAAVTECHGSIRTHRGAHGAPAGRGAAASTGALIRINVREPQIRHGRGVQIAAPAAEALARLDALL
jgi:NAD-dependent SIR2 family protein deacetylase